MMKKQTGGPAFPQQFKGTTEPTLSGMNLRDYFAAKAMQALIYGGWTTMDNEDCAKEAYKSADAMLKAREQSWDK